MSSEESSGGAEKELKFESVVEIEGEKDDLWAFISDPENLVECIPGAENVERVSEREYSLLIEQTIGYFTVTLDGEAELVEMNEPDWIVADGSAYDRGTGSTFDVVAAMEMSAKDEADGTIALAYNADVTVTGGIATYAAQWIRRIFSSRVDDYFENIKAEFESDSTETDTETFA
ncbi:MAG: CoxG family protein [Halodesulfurarchaeum sp.]